MESLSPRVNRRSLLQVIGAGAALSAAGGALLTRPGAARAQGGGKITFWVISPFTPDENAPIFAAARQYQDANGVEVVVESTAPPEMLNKLITAVRGGGGPDVVSVDSAWNATLGAAQILTDVSERFAPIADQFFTGPAGTGRYLDVQYAVPWYTNNVALFYNTKLFEEAGIDGPPASWDELVEKGQALTSGDQYGLMLGGGGFGSFQFWPFAWQNGATLISADGKQAEFGSEAGLGAWQFYSDLFLTHKIVPEDVKSAGESWDQVFAPFIQERAAMVMAGDWAIGAFRDGNPDLQFAVAPLPVGKEAATVIGGYNLGIPATAPNPDEAWKFIEWLSAQEQESILQDYNRIQARADILDTEYASKDPLIKVFIEQSAVGRARATVPAWDEIENTVMADAWDSVLLGEASPADALAEAVEQTNELLAEE
ncbi:MAG: sugar ABC transporter substrate-binding protein [Thermomicrobiales bacterium]